MPAPGRPPSRDDTIFAVASGVGRSALCVIRISGPAAGSVLDEVAGARPPGRRASLRTLRDPVTGERLDQALVLWLPGPQSFTGEDSFELHIHGGAAVRTAVTGVLARVPGCRPAEPGEFTRRAFLNGRMDLSAVEGLADLIDAETEAQRRQAIRQLQGALASQVEQWREALLDAAALLEAAFDFTDEDDVPDDVAIGVSEQLRRVSRDIDAALDRGHAGERLREGFVVVIAGPPNAGKSTLLNALAGREVAIVSPHAGTTRDVLEVRCDLGGYPVTFVDTAGLREAGDPVEKEGIRRARDQIERADLVLALNDGGVETDVPSREAPVLRVRSKADLGSIGIGDVAVSALTGDGMSELLAHVEMRAASALSGAGDAVVTRERHRAALREVSAALTRSLAALDAGHPELGADDLRLGLLALGRITGQVDVERVLDRVFAQFCIGK